MPFRPTAELLISGTVNTALGAYIALFGTPAGLLIGLVAMGVGLMTLLTVAEIPSRAQRR